MNIQAINTLYQNSQNNIQNNLISFKQQFCLNKDKIFEVNTDIIYLAEPTSRSSENKDRKVCHDLLVNARLADNKRFSKKDIKDIETYLFRGYPYTPQKNILRSLLDVSSDSGQKLSALDIIYFLQVLEGETNSIKETVIDLLRYNMNSDKNTTADLDENVFIPVENAPEGLLLQLRKIYIRYSYLPNRERGKLLDDTLKIVSAYDYQCACKAELIADKLKRDNSGYVFDILRQAHGRLDYQHLRQSSQHKFTKLLNSFTPDNVEQIKLDTAYFTSKKQKQEYINAYLDEFLH